MHLAANVLPGAGRSLASLCAACGIELRDAHRAISDAYATAQLLARWLREIPQASWWRGLAERALGIPIVDEDGLRALLARQ